MAAKWPETINKEPMNETMNEVIHVGAYVVTEKLNAKSKKLTNGRVNKKPRWKEKIEKEINEMREEVLKLDELIRRVKVKSRIPPNIRLDEGAFSRRIYLPQSYVFMKTSWSRPVHLSWSYDFKTSSRRLSKSSSRHLQDVLQRYL